MERAATRAHCPVASEVSGGGFGCVGNEENRLLQGQCARRPYTGDWVRKKRSMCHILYFVSFLSVSSNHHRVVVLAWLNQVMREEWHPV